jgi:hypothetical protein
MVRFSNSVSSDDCGTTYGRNRHIPNRIWESAISNADWEPWHVQFDFWNFALAALMAVLVMAKRKQRPKNQPKKEKRDFAQTTFSVFQQGSGTKPNLRSAGQRHSRSSHGR